jgi:hypothetical protein
MGYRSDVCYVVKFFLEGQPEKAFADYVAFQKWVKEEHALTKEVPDPSTQRPAVKTITHSYKNEDGHIRWSREDCAMIFEGENVKWYESFVDVRWHAALLEKVKEYETGNYRFVRIGEEYSDIEEDEHEDTYFEMWHLLDICRSYRVNEDIQFDDEEERKGNE